MYSSKSSAQNVRPRQVSVRTVINVRVLFNEVKHFTVALWSYQPVSVFDRLSKKVKHTAKYTSLYTTYNVLLTSYNIIYYTIDHYTTDPMHSIHSVVHCIQCISY